MFSNPSANTCIRRWREGGREREKERECKYSSFSRLQVDPNTVWPFYNHNNYGNEYHIWQKAGGLAINFTLWHEFLFPFRGVKIKIRWCWICILILDLFTPLNVLANSLANGISLTLLLNMIFWYHLTLSQMKEFAEHNFKSDENCRKFS